MKILPPRLAAGDGDCGLVMGWWVDRRNLSQARTAANKWRNVASALEGALDALGYKSRWIPDLRDIQVRSKKEGGKTFTMTLRWYEPTDALSDVPDSSAPVPNPPKP